MAARETLFSKDIRPIFGAKFGEEIMAEERSSQGKKNLVHWELIHLSN
jgi:hypothetical protein